MSKNKDPLYFSDIDCNEFGEQYTEEVEINEYPVTITYDTMSYTDATKNWHTPSVLLYSKAPDMIEYSLTRSDLYGKKYEAAGYQYESLRLPEWEDWPDWLEKNKAGASCTINAAKSGQHILVRMENAGMVINATTSIPDSIQEPVYLAVTGEKCKITNMKLSREEVALEPNSIEPAFQYLESKSSVKGDIDNVDCAGWWTGHSDGIEITEQKVKVTFVARSYPIASELWHSPLAIIYSSLDGIVNGIAYVEHSVVRSDGFGWKTNAVEFEVEVKNDDSYESEQKWLERNKKGVEFTITAYKKYNLIVLEIEGAGHKVESHTLGFSSNGLPVYFSLSGELCSISNIRIYR